MEISKKEMEVVQRAVSEKSETAVMELMDLQLSYVGGGNAAVDFG